MWPLVVVIIIVFIAYIALTNVNVQHKDEKSVKRDNVVEHSVKKEPMLPYRVSDSILSDAEKSFYHTLKLYVGERAVICPKVGLKDFFFISKEAGKDYMKFFGKIAQKHVDFVLCDPVSMKPLCGIELDDISHTSKKSYERDQFIEKLYKDAGLELIRLSSKSGYTANEIEVALTGVFDQEIDIDDETNMPGDKDSYHTPICPKCDVPMVMRTATKGKNEGKIFWGCTNFPKCRETYSGTHTVPGQTSH